MRILITGAGGMLSPYIITEAKKYGEVITSSRNIGDYHCDLSDLSKVKKMIHAVNPDWVIHVAGYTDVDGCQKNPDKAKKSNSDSALNIAKSLKPSTSLVIISTDQVYPSCSGPHMEANVGPVNVYGETKLEGETAAVKHKKTIILRTSFIGKSMTLHRKSFDDFIKEKIDSRSELFLFSDILFSPLHMKTLSYFVILILKNGIFGVYNIGSRNGFSKSKFGMEVVKRFNLPSEKIKIISSDKISNRALRPKDLRLNVEKIEKKLGIRLPTLIQEIEKI
jgi:dTDP-4-dehydrorhamnose reductase